MNAIVVGDFNIDYKTDNTNKFRIQQIIEDSNCKQVIWDYTRVTERSRTLIDYVITNDQTVRARTNNVLKVSDHETIEIDIVCELSSVNEEQRSFYYLNYDRENLLDILRRNGLNELNVSSVSVIEKANFLEIALKNAIEEMKVEKVVNEKQCEWFGNDLRNLRRSKIAQYNRAAITGLDSEWNEYKNIRSMYKKCVRWTKSKFIKNKVRRSRDQKSMWKTIKKLVLRERKEEISEVVFEGLTVEDDNEKAKKFNEYFVKSVQEINESIVNVQFEDSSLEVHNNRFIFKRITMDGLIDAIKALKQKNDYNLLNPKMLLDSMPEIGDMLLGIINGSMDDGVFPETWKESVVVPVEKVRKAKHCVDFRPVNMLPVYEKVMEKVVQIQLESYLEENELLIAQQSGFRKGHSCESALNCTIMDWKSEIDKKKCVIAVFLDLKRAFETVDREILLKKLQMYGILGKELRWFTSYMSGRTQKTKVNAAISESVNVSLGVPQGSILGVILFLLYINDICSVLKSCKIALFADDGLLYAVGENAIECERIINEDLRDIYKWLSMNKLKLNVTKTKCMAISTRTEVNIEIDGERIECVDKIKYLGVIIDRDLNFKEHVDYVCKKVAKKIGFLRRIRDNLSMCDRIHVYNVIVKPHFEYCPTVLFLANGEMFNRMQKLQNRAMRAILKCNRYTSVRWMLDTLKWMNVKQKIIFNVLVYVFKMKYEMLPGYLRNNLRFIRDVQPYNLRSVNDFRIERCRTTRCKNSLFYKGLQMYNCLPNVLKNESNFIRYKSMLVEYVKENF